MLVFARSTMSLQVSAVDPEMQTPASAGIPATSTVPGMFYCCTSYRNTAVVLTAVVVPGTYFVVYTRTNQFQVYYTFWYCSSSLSSSSAEYRVLRCASIALSNTVGVALARSVLPATYVSVGVGRENTVLSQKKRKQAGRPICALLRPILTAVAVNPNAARQK